MNCVASHPLIDQFDHGAEFAGFGFGDARELFAGFQGVPKLLA
jgi:hypothetical protein